MRCALVMMTLCACNQVFDLRQTAPRDAAFFDAPLDAPFGCSAIGSAPEFSRLLRQHVFQDCSEYNLSADGRAVAYCTELGGQVAEGAVTDTALVGIAGLETQGYITTNQPRISPEGDELLVHQYDSFNVRHDSYQIMKRDGETWSTSRGFGFGDPDMLTGLVFGTMTRGPVRRIMMYDPNSATVHELSFGTGVATEIHAYTLAELAVGSFSGPPNLTEDGLRMVFSSEPPGQTARKAMYSDRSSIAELFRPAVALTDAPNASDLYLSSDCARLYFSAAGSVFFAQQR